jgi:NAD+ synthetase
VWEVDLDQPQLAYLDDHVVQGSPVFPAAAYAEMAFAASRQIAPDGAATIEDLAFHKVLFLADRSERFVQLLADANGAFEIYSATRDSAAEWTRHASGKIRTRRSDQPPHAVDLAAIQARCVVEMPADEVYRALVLGLRDYARKCGFRSAVIGLSGGIDSALTACLAADALGPSQVFGVAMPSRYSSDHSRADAAALARNLGVRFAEIPIEPMHAAYVSSLEAALGAELGDLAAQNVQARIRGQILMAISNQEGSLCLSTGNKSELAVGYCTLYGDMAGGLAVIGDVPKTLVYRVSRVANARAGRERIPENTFVKPPSAELKPGQTDQDSLPPYPELDDILAAYIEERRPFEEIVARGHDPQVVRRVLRMVIGTEYKRRQAAPVLKVTAKAFGEGRRFPIAHGYRY